jgi:hypothetical protein
LSPNNSLFALGKNNRPITALNKMKKLCCKNPKAAIWPSFSGKRIIQEVIAAARIGVGIVAAKNMTGRRGRRDNDETSTPKKPRAVE